MNERRVLITGASSGIGRAAALRLAERGWVVFAAARSVEKLESLAREAAKRSHSIRAVKMDVTDRASIDAAKCEIDDATGGDGVDVIINNAGYGQLAPMNEITEADFRAQLETNVVGVLSVTQAFVPKMMARRRGRIVNVSSMGGRITFPLFGAYHASKYALEAMSDAWRMELRPFGIRVVIIEPGGIATEFSAAAANTLEKYCTPASSYAAVLRGAEQKRDDFQRLSAPVEVCTRAVERAVSCRSPRARIVVSWHARFLLFLGRWLPPWAWDRLVLRGMGITPRTLFGSGG